ncbi:MAG: MauE/DoxX family redox-associated membrane protein [Actinomycetes bacterium]
MKKIQPWLTFSFRLVLGGVLLVAGALKVTDPYGSATSVRAYQILPVDLANLLGFVLPFIEVGIGIFLIVGIWVRLAAIAGGALMLVFVIAIAQAWIRGISLDCGCFGKGGLLASDELPVWNYTLEIARDIALAVVGGYLFRFPQGKLGFDK